MAFERLLAVLVVVLMTAASLRPVSSQTVVTLENGSWFKQQNVTFSDTLYYRFYLEDAYFDVLNQDDPMFNVIVEPCSGDVSVMLNLDDDNPTTDNSFISVSDSKVYNISIPLRFREHRIGVTGMTAGATSLFAIFASVNNTFPPSGQLSLVSTTSDSAELSWTSVSDPGATYTVFYATEEEAKGFNMETLCGWEKYAHQQQLSDPTQTSATLSQLDKTTNYYITVAVTNSQGLTKTYTVEAKTGDSVGEPLVQNSTAIIVAIVFASLMVGLLLFVIIFRKVQLKKLATKRSIAEASSESERLTSDAKE